MATPDLEKIVERLNDLQRRGVIGPYAIGGAFAFIFYAEPIETLDLDVFTDLPMEASGLISTDAGVHAGAFDRGGAADESPEGSPQDRTST